MDDWLQQLSGSQCKVALFLLAAAADSPDGLAAQSILEIADGTGLSWRTVHTILHDLDTHRVLEVLSHAKERTLVRFPKARGMRC
jgi:hypothetical protein